MSVEAVYAPEKNADNETNNSHKNELIIQADPRRWYILLVFSLIGFTQGLVWNTWGPIAASSEFVFSWTDATIALLGNWGPISYVVATAAFAWLMDVKGLRIACLVTAFCVALGTGLRCITSQPPTATWLIHTGQFINGLGGPVAMAAPPMLSAVWFPAHRRTTATAFSSGMNGFGVAVSYIIAPLLVPDVKNKTACLSKNETNNHQHQNSSACLSHKEEMSKRIMLLMYIEFALAASLFLVVLLYFPAKPKYSPSVTASIKRTEFFHATKLLIRNFRFWMLGIPYAVSFGCFGGWSTLLDVILYPHGISQTTAGWLGFYGTLAGLIAGLLIGIFADVFARKMHLFLMVLYSLATLFFLGIVLQCTGIIPLKLVSFYPCFIFGNISLGGFCLFYELSCEVSYPVSEGISNSVLTWLCNFVSLVFLFILMVPNIGTTWLNLSLVSSLAICVPVFIFYKDSYNRFDIDAYQPIVVNVTNTNQNSASTSDDDDHINERVINQGFLQEADEYDRQHLLM